MRVQGAVEGGGAWQVEGVVAGAKTEQGSVVGESLVRLGSVDSESERSSSALRFCETGAEAGCSV
jgi:hypothetical protein